MPTLEYSVREATRLLGEAVREGGPIMVLTGAGVSAASGVPTFRDALTGLWAKFDPMRLATPDAFARDPELVTRWYDHRRLSCAACQPNAAHRAIARLQEGVEARAAIGTPGARFGLVTQNVDDLHERAGSRDVVRLHGSLAAWRCCETGEAWEPPAPPEPIAEFPPRTSRGTLARPGVVWFGEALPPEALERAWELAACSAVCIVVGTSGIVHPAASLPVLAAQAGAAVIEVNPEQTPVSKAARVCVRAAADEVLGRIVADALGMSNPADRPSPRPSPAT